MSKHIQIFVNWPSQIDATDNEGQTISVIRKPRANRPLSDSDACIFRSQLMGDSKPIEGTCLWGDAFASIQHYFNCTSVDGAGKPTAAIEAITRRSS